jgi:hypothetical protein
VPGIGEVIVAITTFFVLAGGLAFTIYEMRRLSEEAERKCERQEVWLDTPIIRSAPRKASVFQSASGRHEEGNRETRDPVIKGRFSTERVAQLTIRLEVLRKETTRLREQNGSQAKVLDAVSTEKAGLQRELEMTRAQLQSATRDLGRAQHDRDLAHLRSASLESEVNALNARLHIAENTANQQ